MKNKEIKELTTTNTALSFELKIARQVAEVGEGLSAHAQGELVAVKSNKLNAEVDRLTGELEGMFHVTSTIKERDATIMLKDQEVSEMAFKIDEINMQASQLNEKLDSLLHVKSTLQERDATTISEDGELSKRADQLSELDGREREATDQVTQMNSQLRCRDGELATARAIISGKELESGRKDKETDALQMQVKDKDDEIKRKTLEIARLDTQLLLRHEELVTSQTARDVVSKELESMSKTTGNSLDWLRNTLQIKEQEVLDKDEELSSIKKIIEQKDLVEERQKEEISRLRDDLRNAATTLDVAMIAAEERERVSVEGSDSPAREPTGASTGARRCAIWLHFCLGSTRRTPHE